MDNRQESGPVREAGPWFADRGDFWGTINQMCLCAKCGKDEFKRPDEPRHRSGLFTPHAHFLCDDCYDSLPDATPTSNIKDNPDD